MVSLVLICQLKSYNTYLQTTQLKLVQSISSEGTMIGAETGAGGALALITGLIGGGCCFG